MEARPGSAGSVRDAQSPCLGAKPTGAGLGEGSRAALEAGGSSGVLPAPARLRKRRRIPEAVETAPTRCAAGGSKRRAGGRARRGRLWLGRTRDGAQPRFPTAASSHASQRRQGDGPCSAQAARARAPPRPCVRRHGRASPAPAVCGRWCGGGRKRRGERREKGERGAGRWAVACEKEMPAFPAASRGTGFGMGVPAVTFIKTGAKLVPETSSGSFFDRRRLKMRLGRLLEGLAEDALTSMIQDWKALQHANRLLPDLYTLAVFLQRNRIPHCICSGDNWPLIFVRKAKSLLLKWYIVFFLRESNGT
ncbi:uncharacterized protein LOC125522885 [Triticum urartu]|uniref:uncharacterized protein LOC125522885 n=1 Tax=Triticum urartu TaxID=4572 RepID=UPI0020437866|nr:uncharacterized protein LOC125522885 [Triticum urartu]XP_048543888.1 uncharacterized protein LOC125522885 [Triticum urartu]